MSIREVRSGVSPLTISKTRKHPCYNAQAGKYARIHLPVAPDCNISCNYCNIQYDCVNETRPGVTSSILSPDQAVRRFLQEREKYENLQVVGVAGPGDALADYGATWDTFNKIKTVFPEVTFCISTNGLLLNHYADDLINFGVSHITVTINAVDPAIGAKIYNKVNFWGKIYTGRQAAEILLQNQLKGLEKLAGKDILCKVNMVMIRGINDYHLEEVVKKVKEYGVFMTNIMPLIPVKGSKFESYPATGITELHDMRKRCSSHIKQMYHCKQCRADAVGCLKENKARKGTVTSEVC